jgi:hypothetical protein
LSETPIRLFRGFIVADSKRDPAVIFNGFHVAA